MWEPLNWKWRKKAFSLCSDEISPGCCSIGCYLEGIAQTVVSPDDSALRPPASGSRGFQMFEGHVRFGSCRVHHTIGWYEWREFLLKMHKENLASQPHLHGWPDGTFEFVFQEKKKYWCKKWKSRTKHYRRNRQLPFFLQSAFRRNWDKHWDSRPPLVQNDQ